MGYPGGPIHWFGGKGQMLSWLIPVLDGIAHTRYVDVFGGGGSVLIAKHPVELETYNDLDSSLVDLFRVLTDPALFDQFYRRVAVLPYSRELYNEYRATWRDADDLIERVVKWWYVARQSFSGKFAHSWSSVTNTVGRGIAGTCSKWLSCIDRLPEIHARLSRVQIEHADFRTILSRYDGPDTLMYLDPPYVTSARRSGGYVHEMTDADHAELVELACGLQSAIVLSGYAHETYDVLTGHGWRLMQRDVACNAVGRVRGSGLKGAGACDANQRRVESLWQNPAALMRSKQLI